jgi:hypothetical protein
LAQQSSLFKKEKITGDFLVPDYYQDFQCKGGLCRDSCCVDWKVNISMQQYFLLHGLNCNKKLKEKIDRTFRPLLNPSHDRYAEIVHTQNGDCPLHKENGYCLLHEKCGEDVLPWVCRYYPRGPRIDYLFEASCANSCEKTLELLFSSTKPLSFNLLKTSFFMVKPQSLPTATEKGNYKKEREAVFSFLNDRSYSISERLINLGEYLGGAKEDSFSLQENSINDYKTILETLSGIFMAFEGRFPRLFEQIEKAIEVYKQSQVDIYLEKKKQFTDKFPDNEIFFEKMLVNEIYFRQFPYQKNISKTDQFLAIIGIYLLVKFLGTALIEENDNLDNLIDIFSKTFTVISHSDFDMQIISQLKANKIATLGVIAKYIAF